MKIPSPNGKVQCWGDNKYKQTEVPLLKNPKQIEAGPYTTCAIHDEGLKCWGQMIEGMPHLSKPGSVSINHHACALDDDGVKRWGDNNLGNLSVPHLVNPRYVEVGALHACAMDDSGVKCWGDSYEDKTNVPKLLNPKAIAVGSLHTCALDDNGVKCWGSNRWGQINVPQ